MTIAAPLHVLFAPQPLQEIFLSCDVFEVLLGGGRGAGKSLALLCDFAAHAQRYEVEAKGLIVRRESIQLRDLIAEAKKLFFPMGWSWNGSSKTFTAPNGATLVFDHLWDEGDASAYQGWNLSWIGVEEAGDYPTSLAIDILRATLRGKAIRYLRLTANPGGPGNSWLKKRFVDPAPEGYKILTEVLEGIEMQRVFIPCTPFDNPANLKNNPAYIAQLRQIGSPELQLAWINGEWNISVGAYFSDVWSPALQVLSPFDIPAHWIRMRGFDWGSSKPSACLFATIAREDFRFKQGGQPRLMRRGSLVIFNEWYPLARNPRGEEIYNKGLYGENDIQGRELALFSQAQKCRFDGCVADPSIFDDRGGKSIYLQLQEGAAKEKLSLTFDPAPNYRVEGWLELRRLLRNSLHINPEEPGLYIFSRCVHLIRTLPAIQRDPKKPDDLNSKEEDHLLDVLRYIDNSLEASSGGFGKFRS